jgi:AcrR family transcriptional regulator
VAPTASTTAHAGRPRDPEISGAILSATLDVLGEEGYGGLTIAAVALRAGVHKPAVYRRWANKLDLAVAAIQLLAPQFDDPDTGEIRADLVQMLVAVAGAAHERGRLTTGLRLQADMTADPALAAAVETSIVAPRRAVTAAVLERAVGNGQLRPGIDIEMAIDMLFAPVSRKALRSGDMRVSRREATRIVDQLLDGLDAGSDRGRRS